MDFLEIMINYIKPELLVLIPILWAIGANLKKSTLKDWLIPFILLLICILLTTSYTLLNGFNFMALWSGIMQGLVVWAVEGQIYQSYKQAKEKK